MSNSYISGKPAGCTAPGESLRGSCKSKGVYLIAKEIKFIRPEKFSNTFLALGGFQ